MKEKLKQYSGYAALTTGATAGLFIIASMFGGAANAATGDDPVSDAFTDMGGKITLYGAAVVGLVVASTLIFLGIKYLRKGASKA